MSSRSLPDPRRISVSDVTLSVHEAGSGPAIVFCHGFPDLARSWAHVFDAVVANGYRAIAPDQRGYGGSDAPGGIESYDIEHLSGDLVGLLDALGVERAVFVGHDWGGFVAWAMPLLYPDRCLGVVGVNTPYVPFVRTDAMRALFPDPEKLYILWFQQPGVAEAFLDPRARIVFEALYRRAGPPEVASLAELPDANPFLRIEELERDGDPLLTPEELELYVEAYAENGFRGPVSWYRNFDRNGELLPAMGVERLELPALMVTAAWDAALPPAAADGMKDLCADLERHDLDACGHWTPREKPEELSALLLDWLDRKIRGRAQGGTG